MISLKNLKWLQQKQLELDKYILKKNNLTTQQTYEKRKIAFIVELCEFINEQRGFKYWSKKPASSINILLEEYIDGIHFLISIANTLNFDFKDFNYKKLENFKNLSISDLFLMVLDQFNSFCKNNTIDNFVEAFNLYLMIFEKLDCSEQFLIDIYSRKNEINFLRQDNNY